MILTADYHTHTPYSHGKNTIDENVAQAKARGLKEVAISDHGFSHVVYGLRRNEVEAYKAECKAAEEKYGIKKDQFLDLKALKGDSSDNIPGNSSSKTSRSNSCSKSSNPNWLISISINDNSSFNLSNSSLAIFS